MSHEDFAQFLNFLSPDTEEAGRCYTRLHKKLVNFFGFKGISDPVSAADETLDRAALKILKGTPVPDLDRYCSGIARNIVKEKLQREQRANATSLDFIQNTGSNSDDEVERIYTVLKPCFEQLEVEDQKLLQAYCQILRGRERAEHRRLMAETMHTTVLALRMRVTRLRGTLADCVEKRSNEKLMPL